MVISTRVPPKKRVESEQCGKVLNVAYGHLTHLPLQILTFVSVVKEE